ncbi:hypothetical protein [Methylococcus sp. BF19-07]|uniref:hypothetical protein n=1 Tax=Methylococcus sp. BF19-07 TaxID=2743472 RepID=UPI0018DF0C49|nr:hypothetical protein [Methylococcus sp. BF19-07]
MVRYIAFWVLVACVVPAWTTLPETLRLSGETGLVGFSVGGRAIAFSSIGEQAQVWLRKPPEGSAPETSPLRLKVVHLLRDAIPMEISTRLPARTRRLAARMAPLAGGDGDPADQPPTAPPGQHADDRKQHA